MFCHLSPHISVSRPFSSYREVIYGTSFIGWLSGRKWELGFFFCLLSPQKWKQTKRAQTRKPFPCLCLVWVVLLSGSLLWTHTENTSLRRCLKAKLTDYWWPLSSCFNYCNSSILSTTKIFFPYLYTGVRTHKAPAHWSSSQLFPAQ